MAPFDPTGDTKDERLLPVILDAAFRDAEQGSVVAANLLNLLNDAQLRKPVSAQIGDFLAQERIDVGVASVITIALADAGAFDIPNLSRGLVIGGLSKEAKHQNVLKHLVHMLSAPQFATSVRKALSEGLTSEDADVAWGSARLLCEHSERTDSDLAGAILTGGLKKESRRDQARTWLHELITGPFMAPNALKAMYKAAEEGLKRKYDGSLQDAALSWEIVRCLLVGGKYEPEYVPDAVAYGGLIKRENHSDVIEVLRPLLRNDAAFAERLVNKLWSVLGSSDGKSSESNALSWGAVRLLIETGHLHPENEWGLLQPDASKAVEPTESFTRILRVMIRNIATEATAREFMQSVLKNPKTSAASRRALVGLLDSESTEVAFGAAHALADLGDFNHLSLAVSVAKHGLGKESTHEQALQILDNLRTIPSMAQAVRTALLLAASGKDEAPARAAAEYLMDKGDLANPAVPRGLIQGRWWWRKGPQDTIQRLQTLLNTPAAHQSTIDALLATLYQEEKQFPQFDLGLLLVRAEVPLYDRILAAMTEASKHGMAVAPLALLALTGRQQEALEGARRFGFAELAEILSE